MEIVLKDVTFFFLIANRNKSFISNVGFFPPLDFFSNFFLYLLETRQHRMGW